MRPRAACAPRGSHPTGAPILFCVIDNGEADVPLRSEKRDQFSLASWSHKGHSYLVIGSMESLAAIAPQLESKRHLRSIFYQVRSVPAAQRM